MAWLIETILRYPKRSVASGLFVILVCAIIAWVYFVWQNPKQIFEDMLSSNLQTLSVTRHVVAGNSAQGVDQTIRLEMGSTNAADWLVAAHQTGTDVTTDSIGTPTAGYIRYTKLTTVARKASGKAYDFSSALNTWAKSDNQTDATLQGLFSQTLLDITSAPTPPIANMPIAEREKLLRFIHDEKVFVPDYSKVKSAAVAGRPVYTYTVSVNLAAYVRLMQAFARDLGLHNLDSTDPNQYNGLAPISFTMSVDRLSHQLAEIDFAKTGFSEQYSDWGLLTSISVPAHGISTTELQTRLQALTTQN